jgi:hypothetical protein
MPYHCERSAALITGLAGRRGRRGLLSNGDMRAAPISLEEKRRIL